MNILNISSFARSQEKTEQWLDDVKKFVHLEKEQDAYTVLRTVLHAMRDRLTVHQSANFAAQLPLLLAGVYFEGWSPKNVPSGLKTQAELLKIVQDNAPKYVIPLDAVMGVFSVIKQRITRGEVDGITSEMPQDIADLWAGVVNVENIKK